MKDHPAFVQKIQAALAPIQPVINMLEQPAPIFNDFHLDDLNGDGTTTILEVLESFLGAASPGSVKFINAVVDINNLINAIPINATNIMLPFLQTRKGSITTYGRSAIQRGVRGTASKIWIE